MASATTLALKNAAAATVNYYPTLIATGSKAVYTDRTNSKLALQSHAALMYNESSEQRRASGKVDYRVEDATTGKISTGFGEFAFRIPNAFSATDRQELEARLRQMIDDAIVTAAVENGETPW